MTSTGTCFRDNMKPRAAAPGLVSLWWPLPVAPMNLHAELAGLFAGWF